MSEADPKQNGLSSRLAHATDGAYEDAYNDNAAFNDWFDKQRQVKFASQSDKKNVYRFRPSAVLFARDRRAYEEELRLWQDGSAEENQRQLANNIKGRQHSHALQSLQESVERGRIVPFVGAGLSHYQLPGHNTPLFPLWSTALKDIGKSVRRYDKSAFENTMRRYQYMDAAEVLWQADQTEVTRYIKETFASTKTKAYGVSDTSHLLSSVSKGCIVTTNYDRVIERVINFDAHSLAYGRSTDEAVIKKIVQGERVLIKLHGDADNPETHVFSKSHYQDAYGSSGIDFSLPLPRALRHLYVSQSLLFLGCSLADDQTVHTFKEIRDNSGFDIPQHFALMPCPSRQQITERGSALRKLNIEPIWYPKTNHGFVHRYLRLLVDVADGRLSSVVPQA